MSKLMLLTYVLDEQNNSLISQRAGGEIEEKTHQTCEYVCVKSKNFVSSYFIFPLEQWQKWEYCIECYSYQVTFCKAEGRSVGFV